MSTYLSSSHKAIAMGLDSKIFTFTSHTDIVIQNKWSDSPETDGDLFCPEKCIIHKAQNCVPAVCFAIYMIIVAVLTKQ